MGRDVDGWKQLETIFLSLRQANVTVLERGRGGDGAVRIGGRGILGRAALLALVLALAPAIVFAKLLE